MHSVTVSQTDRRTNDRILPIADRTLSHESETLALHHRHVSLQYIVWTVGRSYRPKRESYWNRISLTLSSHVFMEQRQSSHCPLTTLRWGV